MDDTIEKLVDVCSDLLDNSLFDDPEEREGISADLGYYSCKKEYKLPVDPYDKDLYGILYKRLQDLYERGDRR